MTQRPEPPETSPSPELVLEVEDLIVRYRGAAGNAVDGVDLTIEPGRSLGLVGESGSGKSSVARSILGLHPSTGTIRFEGRPIGDLRGSQLRRTRARLQMIFQDPYGTLDPRMPVGRQVAEPLLVHGLVRRADVQTRVRDLFVDVGLDPGLSTRYAHELSGGQRQRIAIARAIGLSPSLLVCDEPTSSLDVSVQAQVIELLRTLQQTRGLAYLFISHNLGVVRQLCDRVAVMYLGRVVESGPVESVFDDPQHAYTKALLAAVLEPDPTMRNAPPAVDTDLVSPEQLDDRLEESS